jgi:hypothetical protein
MAIVLADEIQQIVQMSRRQPGRLGYRASLRSGGFPGSGGGAGLFLALLPAWAAQVFGSAVVAVCPGNFRHCIAAAAALA